MNDSILCSYDVKRVFYNDYPVFYSQGGMSAEVCVAKCLGSLNGAESSSWEPSDKNKGPHPVALHENFLKVSIKKTVNLYQTYANGMQGKVDTVIFGPGSMAVPYLCHHLNAIYLPTQFLACFDSIDQLRRALGSAVQQKIRSYAVAGYDASIEKIGVVWLKLLQLPKAYIRMMREWQIKQVLFVDNEQTFCGENLFRKVLEIDKRSEDPIKSFGKEIIGPPYMEKEVQAQDIFIHYISFGQNTSLSGFQQDFNELISRIKDLHQVALGSFHRGDDWESSMTKQITRLRSDIPSSLNISTSLLKATDSIHLYYLPMHLALYKISKYKGYPTTIAMNPYFLCNPVYEDFMNQIPFCFWQGNPQKDTAQNLKKQLSFASTLRWSPNDSIKDVWLKTTSNFGNWNQSERKALEKEIANCLKLQNLSLNEPEVLNGTNNAGWTKWIIDTLKKFESSDDFRKWKESRNFLKIEDLKIIVSEWGQQSGLIIT